MTFCTGVAGVVLVSRSLNSNVGVPVWRAASAPSTAKSRSTMAPFPAGRDRVAQLGEEMADRLPSFGAAGQPAPACSDQTDEGKAAVDRHAIILASPVDPIDQQRLDIGLEVGQSGVARDELLPGVKAEQRLGCAGGTGIKCDR